MKASLALLAVAIAACTPSAGAPAPAPPGPDADLAIDPACVAHCAHAASLGCTEGNAPSCPSVCTVSEGTVIGRTVDWSCVERATSSAAARACGIRFCMWGTK